MNAAPPSDPIPLQFAALAADVAELKRRVSRLERGDIPVCRRNLRKPKRVPDVKEPEHLDRWTSWVEYLTLKREEVTGQVYSRKRGEAVPTSITYFAARKGLSPSEVSRWLKRRGIAAGSIPDLSIRRALREEIDRMKRGASQGKA